MSLIDLFQAFTERGNEIYEQLSEEMQNYLDEIEEIQNEPSRKKYVLVKDMKEIDFPDLLEEEIDEVTDYHVTFQDIEKGIVTGVVEFAEPVQLTKRLKDKYNIEYAKMTISEIKHFTRLAKRSASKVSKQINDVSSALARWLGY